MKDVGARDAILSVSGKLKKDPTTAK
jgi:hypothetical protein